MVVSCPQVLQLAFIDSHAAAIKHIVIRVEKTMGVVKAYLQFKPVTATKQMARATQCCARVPKSLPEVRPVATLIPPRTKETRRKRVRTR